MATEPKASTAKMAVKLPKEIFAIEVENHELLKLVYVAHQANGRPNLAKTLRRGQVSGGGKKPWRQKGTGNARTGSIRNPIWRGGGIVFGPDGTENYTKSVNQKAKKTALKQALSLQAKAGIVDVVANFTVTSGKTKDAVKQLDKLGATNRPLIIVDNIDEKTKLATANLQTIKLVKVANLNVVDVLDAQKVVITEGAIKALEVRLGGAK